MRVVSLEASGTCVWLPLGVELRTAMQWCDISWVELWWRSGLSVPGDPLRVMVRAQDTCGHTSQGGDGGKVGIPDAYGPANHLPPNRKLLLAPVAVGAGGDSTIPLYCCMQDE